MTRAAAAIAAVAAAAAVPARARAPEVVRWQDAGARVGEVITVEGTVVRARVGGGACTLEFAPDDATALRVVLMLALFQSPDDPERLYGGRLVQASGRVQRFQGRPEMIIRRADQITLVDEGASTATPPPPPATAPPSPPPTPSSPPPTSPPPPVPPASPPAAPRASPDPCAQAQERREAARRDLAARAEDAARCLRAAASPCADERDAVDAALEALRTRESEAAAACR